MSQQWDKKSPYEESNPRPLDSALRCFTLKQQGILLLPARRYDSPSQDTPAVFCQSSWQFARNQS